MAEVSGNNIAKVVEEFEYHRFNASPGKKVAAAAAATKMEYGRSAPSSNFQAPPKVAHQFAAKTYDADDAPSSDESDDEVGEDAIWAALEEACAKLGYTLQAMKDMLEDDGKFPPSDIFDLVMSQTGAKNPSKVRNMLRSQRTKVLEKVINALKNLPKPDSQTDAEKKTQEAIKRIGKCCLGYEWIKEQGGYRCAGGSHFCTDDEIEQASIMDLD